MFTLLFSFIGFLLSVYLVLPQFVEGVQVPAFLSQYFPFIYMFLFFAIKLELIFVLKKVIKLKNLETAHLKVENDLASMTEKLHEEKKQHNDTKNKLTQVEKKSKEQTTELKRDLEKVEKELNAQQRLVQSSKEEIQKLNLAYQNEVKKLETIEKKLNESQTQSRTEGQSNDLKALQVVSLLQEKGRLLDFLMNDVSQYSDVQVGGAARIVHKGCSEVLKEYFEIHPVTSENEGSTIELGKEFDGQEFRLLGKVGEPPYKGRLLHKGWYTHKIKLPEIVSLAKGQGHKNVIFPAEVEIQ